MSLNRSFGSEIGNKIEKMTAATNANDIADVSPAKLAQPLNSSQEMDKIEENQGVSRLPKALAVEVYSKIQNSTLQKEDLLDEIEDLIDQIFYPGEKLMNSGKEFTVVSSEKRGGLTIYTMDDGSKIGHRDLKRKKGLSVEEIKNIAMEDSEFSEEEKQWKVKESVLQGIEIREKTKKLAPIFNKRASSGAQKMAITLDSDEEGIDQNLKLQTPKNPARISGGPAASANRRQMEKKLEKERKEKEKLEKKEKEKEEKLKKKEEEKAKKLQEKEEKKSKKNGTMDAFVKKENSSPSSSTTAPLFSPSKWGEKRMALGVKKLDDAWKKRDQEAFNEACSWCEKYLSGNQRNTFENPIYKFAVQKTVDKTKDKAAMKGMKWAKKAEYKLEMALKRKEQYVQYEPKIKAWFSEDIALDDLLVTGDRLELTGARKIECDEELLKCMEITQFFVSMRKILIWNENITAEQLQKDLHAGLEGFSNSTYKMMANLLETALQEKEHEKVAHCNARLSEFPITVHTITELIRAFFIGKTEMSFKRDCGRGGDAEEEEEEEEDEEEEENDQNQEKDTKEEDPEDPEDQEEKPKENEEKVKEEENEEVPELPTDEDEEEEAQKQRVLALFVDSAHFYEWPAHKQLEVLYALKEVVHGLPIIREWFLRDANSEQLTGLKEQANKITKKIEQFNQQLSDLPPGEITEDMTRNQTREMEKIQKKRQQLEKSLDDLKDELETNREKAARERDDLERIFRLTVIGTDRHLRRYYWFAYSQDAGIWVQDFGTTTYEKWVRECAEKGFLDVESGEVENRPEYVDLPILSSEPVQTWHKLDTEHDIRNLAENLKKNGKREKMLKKYLQNNMNDILASLPKVEPPKKANSNGKAASEEPKEEEIEEKPEIVSNEEEMDQTDAVPRFTGPFSSLKMTMIELLNDWKASGISKIGDSAIFETRLDDASSLEEMKRLCHELTTSIPKEVLIEKFPMVEALAKKCFSHLKMYRFCRRIQEATNSSCLHMLLAYFDARIDSKRTLQELPCNVCRKKTGIERKLMCKKCTAVYHYNCHRPTIGRQLFEEEGFKERWWCAKCTKEDRRRQLEAKKEHGAGATDGSDEEEEEEHDEMLDDEEPMSRGRSAKRKANAAMRDVLEFEGVLRQPQAPPPPKRAKKEVKAEVQELFNSIEKTNPRLYKVIQMIPAQSRSTRNSNMETRSLPEIEEDLDVYTSAEQLRTDLAAFFKQARGYMETHNSRKIDEFDLLISELNFV